MEDSCGPTKPKRFLINVKAGTSSSNAGEITGNVKQVDLPHLVVGKILENLDFEDLLQCSLVSKFWNHEARRLLRVKHKCALFVNLDQSPVIEIIQLETTLAEAKWLLPYGSLSIIKRYRTNPIVWWTWDERKFVENAIEKIIRRAGPFEVVQLDVNCGASISVEACIIKKLLAEVSKTVKVMIAKNLNGWNLFENATRLPELKKLEIHSADITFPLDETRIQDFLKYSEKLETVGLMSSKWLKLLETIPPARKLAVVKEFTCADMYIDPRRAAEFAELEPKLEKLYISKQPHNRYSRNRSDETRSISMSLLLSSRASLTELQVTYEMLQQIRREKPFVLFDNVRCLTVEAPYDMHREGLERNQTIIALFPKLEDLIVIKEAEAPPVYDVSDED